MKRYSVYTVTSGIGNKVRNPHRILDNETGSTVDEFTSKAAANGTARDMNEDLKT